MPAMQLWQTVLILSSLFLVLSSQTFSVNLDASDNEYLNIEVEWGDPAQKFNVLVDTTDHTSWVYDQDVDTESETMDTAASETFQDEDRTETFEYQNEDTKLEFATDTFTISDHSLPDTEFAVATENFTITDNEGLSGFLSLDRSNAITSALKSNGYIENETISIDVPNQKLYFGPHTPSDIDTESNGTSCSTTDNDDLKILWTFDIELYIDDIRALGTNSFRGVIDAASPYITIYAKHQTYFEALWQLIDKSQGSPYNCNYTTRLCTTSSAIMEDMTVVVTDTSWNISISASDVLSDDYLQFLNVNDTDYTTDTDFVLFLGRPFLQQLMVTLDYESDELTFYTFATETSSLDWVTIGIVFGSVAVFAILFFGVYYWKYGKIPPPTNSDAEEQSHVNNSDYVSTQPISSLLRGPVQAVGSSSAVVGPGAASSQYSGPSGLDEDDDDYQRQLQQAQRISAIESQQKREQQMKEERERQGQIMMEEQKQQAELQQAQSAQQQRIGGSAPKPSDADDLRARRLKFLEEQQKKQQEEDGDQ